MKKLIAAIAFLSLFASTTVLSAGCYTQKEFEAEQGLRIHSELMVIALTCMKMPQGGQALYSKYQSFTTKNKSTLTGYENDMIGYFRRAGVAKPEVTFHNMRTGLANRISKLAISMSTSSFCQKYGPHVDAALAMEPGKFRRWAQHPEPQSPTTRPVCR